MEIPDLPNKSVGNFLAATLSGKKRRFMKSFYYWTVTAKLFIYIIIE